MFGRCSATYKARVETTRNGHFMGGDLNTNAHAMHVAGQWETCGMHRGGPLLGHDFESAWGKHPGA